MAQNISLLSSPVLTLMTPFCFRPSVLNITGTSAKYKLSRHRTVGYFCRGSAAELPFVIFTPADCGGKLRQESSVETRQKISQSLRSFEMTGEWLCSGLDAAPKASLPKALFESDTAGSVLFHFPEAARRRAHGTTASFLNHIYSLHIL